MLSKLKIENWKILAKQAGFTPSLKNGFGLAVLFSNKTKPFFSRGFTLLELMVVITIATIITTALVIQNSKWNDQLAVNTQTYDLSLMIRQAQFYSLAVRENKDVVGDKFNVGYGVSVGVLNPNQLTFFVDKDKDLKLDSGEEIETKNLTRGVYVDRVCGTVMVFGNPWQICSGAAPYVTLKRIDLSFFRPNTIASARFLNNGLQDITYLGGNPYRFPVYIYLRSPQGNESRVKIDQNGEISVQ